jgi:hypothetical protein
MSSDHLIDGEMAEGYRDGLNPKSPEPSADRAQSYRYGFLNGREELRRKSWRPGLIHGHPAAYNR